MKQAIWEMAEICPILVTPPALLPQSGGKLAAQK
jgi:hypothetical protein